MCIVYIAGRVSLEIRIVTEGRDLVAGCCCWKVPLLKPENFDKFVANSSDSIFDRSKRISR